MEIKGYTEISKEEYVRLPAGVGIEVMINQGDETYYFKKVQTFPIVFEGESNKIEVENCAIRIIDLGDNESVAFEYDGDFPLLLKAVKKAEEVMKKDGR